MNQAMESHWSKLNVDYSYSRWN